VLEPEAPAEPALMHGKERKAERGQRNKREGTREREKAKGNGKREETTNQLFLSTEPVSLFSADRQHLSYDGCLEVREEIIRTVLCCIGH